MKKSKLIWAPYPYKAGFCITDDTDGAELWSVRIVYDFLKSINLVTTKTVWIMLPEEPSGIPQKASYPKRDMNISTVTFENSEYFDYCKELFRSGFEICLHGATSGNNIREKTVKAIRSIRENFGQSDTFICHSKNAENPYWEEKVTSNKIIRLLLSLFSKHICSGEDENSPYFWGDICQEYIQQIRLFRTRKINTLSINPSMPYFDAKKPFVKGWFSATKRSFRDCTTAEALFELKQSYGLTILYQYLHRYADEYTQRVTNTFKEGAVRLANDEEILKDTCRNIMNRLRLLHGVFILYRGKYFWIINTNKIKIENLQILLPEGYECLTDNRFIRQEGRILHILNIPAKEILKFFMNKKIIFTGKHTKKLNRPNKSRVNFRYGNLYVNLSEKEGKTVRNLTLPPNSFYLVFQDESLKHLWPMSKIGYFEELRLIWGQIFIIFREILFRGRSFNIHKFLSGSKLTLENQNNW